MFPTLYHFFKDTIGLELNFLQVVNTFGFFVALSVAGAFWSMSREMARRSHLGQFPMVSVKETRGKAFPVSDYVLNGVLAFLFGYKIIYLLTEAGGDFQPQEHIFNLDGNLLYGLLCAALITGWRFYTDKKQRLAEPVTETREMDASVHMGSITTVALISGFLGAKIFHIFEDLHGLTFKVFIDNFLSTGGWTFFGGLVCGAAGVLVYCYRKGLSLLRILDSGGPAMMLSYGIGRFGCHFSGDGDWGIANLSPKPMSWLPDWAWAYTYPNNVLSGSSGSLEGMKPIKDCVGQYCHELSIPVWPTPLYEALAGIALFLLLWKVIRFKAKSPGNVFAWYMVLAGVERFSIEIIREHGSSLYRIGGLVFSQAQLISFLLMLFGGIWLLFGKKILAWHNGRKGRKTAALA